MLYPAELRGRARALCVVPATHRVKSAAPVAASKIEPGKEGFSKFSTPSPIKRRDALDFGGQQQNIRTLTRPSGAQIVRGLPTP